MTFLFLEIPLSVGNCLAVIEFPSGIPLIPNATEIDFERDLATILSEKFDTIRQGDSIGLLDICGRYAVLKHWPEALGGIVQLWASMGIVSYDCDYCVMVSMGK